MTMELVAVFVFLLLEETETVTTVVSAGYLSSIVPRIHDDERANSKCP